MLLIEARELQVGDVILEGSRELPVKMLERGESCRGVHVNVVRRSAVYRKATKTREAGFNANRGQMLHNDGCYAPCAPVVVRRAN